MIKDEKLIRIHQKKRIIEEQLEDSRKSYSYLKESMEDYLLFEQESHQFYDELYNYFRGTSLQSNLSRRMDNIADEQEFYRKQLNIELELLRDEQSDLNSQLELLTQESQEETE